MIRAVDGASRPLGLLARATCFAKMRATRRRPSSQGGESGGRREKRRTLIESKAKPLATPKELADFLAEVERRAYKQALFAIRDDHLALDIVQDAMLKLAEKYGQRPPGELP